ncbi:hypothetical protein [Agrobacterium tumefaciens]|uniref:hypothetical protein n=1 Tax=Agrobacterium tumefaciens TaxID=358 RepID=UPI0021D3030F|nr:hypothetical protein [Agrobacterium tumefaciens]UXS05117.1 hypothetical protein FY156_27215 [Agrobacterium tumefaciens]
MSKSFHGPFRITGNVDVELGRDGDVFITFCDEYSNVVGAILDENAVRDVVEGLQRVLFSASKRNTQSLRELEIAPGR